MKISKANREQGFSGSVIFILESTVSRFCDTWHNDLRMIRDPLEARGCHPIARLALFVRQVCRKAVNHKQASRVLIIGRETLVLFF